MKTKCPNCGNYYPPRSNKIFCSSLCRVTWHRNRNKNKTDKTGLTMNNKDAAGNTPKPRTTFETKWHEMVKTGQVKQLMADLQTQQALPLGEKIKQSKAKIKCWYESFNGQVAVSFSGGKDSSVLLWLVRQLYPEVPAVFVNTGLEYPELVSMVRNTENVTILRPQIPFHTILKEHGYPLVSKKVARGISILRHPTNKNKNVYRLYDEGINRFGQEVNGFKIANRWRFLINAPFDCTDKCCQVMKKEPIHRYQRETKRLPFIGTMAADSKNREKIYLQHGCNGYDLKEPKSTPLGFWTEQDILQAIGQYNIPYPSVYGKIRKINGRLSCSGLKRTGCIFCMFAMQMEPAPNRFQKLYHTHPKLYDFCMDKLGIEDVLQYVVHNCPDKSIKRKFSLNKTLF